MKQTPAPPAAMTGHATQAMQAMQASEQGLRIDGLCLSYGSQAVLRGLDTPQLPPGSVTALIGPNGSGKSTLLRALSGLARVDRGQALLDGMDLLRLSARERSRKVVYMPQALPKPVGMSVFESVAVAAGATARVRRTRDELMRIGAMLEHLGIGALASRPLNALSGGQRQLAGLAQALIRRPRVLLLDEPLSALDLNFQFHVMQLLRHETRVHDLITVVVLHDLNSALRHADLALMLRRGRVLVHGSPAEVISPSTLAAAYGVQGRLDAGPAGATHVYIERLLPGGFDAAAHSPNGLR